MITLVARVRCPMCGFDFDCRVEAVDKVDADVRCAVHFDFPCPSHGGVLRLPGSLFLPAGGQPEEGTTFLVGRNTVSGEAEKPRRNWWRSWA